MSTDPTGPARAPGGAVRHASARPLLVTNDFLPVVGGIQQYTDNVLARLDDAAAFAPHHPAAAEHDQSAPYPVHRSSDPPDRLRGPDGWMLPTEAVTAQVAAAVVEHGANVLLFAAPWPLVPIAARLGLPAVVMTHGAELVMPANLPGAAGLLRRHLRSAALLTTVSAWTGRHLRDLVGADGPPIRFLRTGVPLDTFAPTVDGTRVRARHGLGDDPVAVFVGRHVARKGIDVLVEHWSRVREHVPRARLLVTGTGDLTDRLMATAAARDDDAIVFAGRVPWDELPAHHAAGDVFVHPNRTRWGGLEQEGFGVIFLEAQAVGRPVVAGDSGGSPEALVPGETGLLVDGTDPSEVVAAVVTLLSDRERARAMGRAGRRFVEEHFDWDRIVAGFRDDLDAVVAGTPPPSAPALGGGPEPGTDGPTPRRR
ncbi:glycosyltransferase family 4 protein [Salsipaludibacter albus]|uniref:glycosyltransferase family 4 protein n=1 Tax=Salsipaludibacter albus TaxID=2849650 RepID=UPI001EE4604F|nr:glycosyltransferase family 4 protein [Salsipaludibacter albus]